MLKKYLPICWFASFPENLKTSNAFIWKNIIFYLFAGLFIQVNITDPVVALLQVFLELLITLIFVALLLVIKGSLTQFKIVFTTFILCENLSYLAALPIVIWFIAVRASDYFMYPIYAGILLIVWFCAIISYLLQYYFQYRLTLSILISILYFLSTYLVSYALLVI